MEALLYVLGFFVIWMTVAGIVWSVDRLVIKNLIGRTLIPETYWQ